MNIFRGPRLFVLSALILLLVCAGCASDIYPSEYQKSLDSCEANGGLTRIFVMADALNVYCVNGAEFRFSRKAN